MKMSDLVQKNGIKTETKDEKPKTTSAPRRRYFWDEDAAPEALAQEVKKEDAVEASKPAPLQNEIRNESIRAQKVQSSSIESKAFNRVQEGSIDSLGSIVSKGSKESLEVKRVQPKSVKRVQKGSLEDDHSSAIELNKVQISSTNSTEPSIGETRVLQWLGERQLEDQTILFRAEECSDATTLTRDGSKTAVKRLRAKGYIELLESRRGRYTAFGLYRITEKGKQFLEYKSKTPAPAHWVHRGSIGFSNRVQSGSCSSSNLSSSLKSLKETTTTSEPYWINIPESLKNKVQLTQLRLLLDSGIISEETLEDSLFGFAMDLEKGLVKSKIGNPIAVLIGALKNGGYVSEQYLSGKKAELQEAQSRAAELQKVREGLESQKLIADFEKFKVDYPEAADKLKPNASFVKSFETGSVGYKAWLQNFKENREKN